MFDYNKSERALVDDLVKLLENNTRVPLYCYVDRDTPDRSAHSEWDLLLVTPTDTVFVEAKKGDALLTPAQALHHQRIGMSGSLRVRSLIVRFRPTEIEIDEPAWSSYPVHCEYSDVAFTARLVRSLLKHEYTL